MSKRIVLLSTNVNGGMIQYTLEMYKRLFDLKYEAYCFIPKSSVFNISSDYKENMVLFQLQSKAGKAIRKVTKFFPRNDVALRIAPEIEKVSPDAVWLTDNALLTTQVGRILSNKNAVILTMHDAGGTHPTNNNSLADSFRTYIRQKSSAELEKKCRTILVLSKRSKEKYLQLNPCYADKVEMMPLGPHIPDAEEKQPTKNSAKDFYLFFGRIDKYKGLSTLLRAYGKIPGSKIPLVVAGSGTLTNDEKTLCENENVILINRYIDDGEMIWLIKNARCVVLPYIEATQSGIIPLAYHFGVPVITSDVDGLTQFVDDGVTGIVCAAECEYVDAMQKLCNPEIRAALSTGAKKYENEKLNWDKNIDDLIRKI